MDLELAWLRSWLEVVDSGGFARAAERIHLSQPRISAHVASLEHVLGCTLIERRLRPLTLTEQGKRLLPRARSIVAAVDDTMSDLRSTQTTVAGRVTIASFVSASSEFLPGLILQLRSANPLVEVAVLDGDVQAIEAALSDRRASIAIRPLRPEPADRALAMRPLWREPFVLLAPHGHPLLASKTLTLEQIAGYPVITIGDPLADQAEPPRTTVRHRFPPSDDPGRDGSSRTWSRTREPPGGDHGPNRRTRGPRDRESSPSSRCRGLVAFRTTRQSRRAGPHRSRGCQSATGGHVCRSRWRLRRPAGPAAPAPDISGSDRRHPSFGVDGPTKPWLNGHLVRCRRDIRLTP